MHKRKRTTGQGRGRSGEFSGGTEAIGGIFILFYYSFKLPRNR